MTTTKPKTTKPPTRRFTPPIGRTAHPSRCPRCQQPTIRGLDHDRSALDTRVDHTPLDPAGELTALLTGRATYELTAHANAYRIDHRDPEHIRHRPAGRQPNTDVVPIHRCHERMPAIPSRIPNGKPRTEETKCPF